LSESEYDEFLTDRSYAQARLEELYENFPELFPDAFPEGYAFFRESTARASSRNGLPGSYAIAFEPRLPVSSYGAYTH
jgi:hypothetical protein